VMMRLSPRSTLFPYTTLFRSVLELQGQKKLLALGQGLDGIDECGSQALRKQAIKRIIQGWLLGARYGCIGTIAAIIVITCQVFIVKDLHPSGLFQHYLVLLKRDFEFFCDFSF